MKGHRWTTAALTLLVLATGRAAEPAPDDAPAQEPAPQTEAPKPQQPPQGADGGKPAAKEEGGVEVFVPSEEISEDFAVSFPVDI